MTAILSAGTFFLQRRHLTRLHSLDNLLLAASRPLMPSAIALWLGSASAGQVSSSFTAAVAVEEVGLRIATDMLLNVSLS
jgi:hypothetical protein